MYNLRKIGQHLHCKINFSFRVVFFWDTLQFQRLDVFSNNSIQCICCICYSVSFHPMIQVAFSKREISYFKPFLFSRFGAIIKFNHKKFKKNQHTHFHFQSQPGVASEILENEAENQQLLPKMDKSAWNKNKQVFFRKVA